MIDSMMTVTGAGWGRRQTHPHMPRLGAHRPIHPVAGTLRETAQGHFIRFAAARVRPDLARYAGRLLPGSSHGRSVDVDDRRTVTSTDYDEPTT
jgi:hypothetical protein